MMFRVLTSGNFFFVQLAAFRAGVEDVMSVAALSPFSELELQVCSRV